MGRFAPRLLHYITHAASGSGGGAKRPEISERWKNKNKLQSTRRGPALSKRQLTNLLGAEREQRCMRTHIVPASLSPLSPIGCSTLVCSTLAPEGVPLDFGCRWRSTGLGSEGAPACGVRVCSSAVARAPERAKAAEHTQTSHAQAPRTAMAPEGVSCVSSVSRPSCQGSARAPRCPRPS